jgi:hypothetical protein
MMAGNFHRKIIVATPFYASVWSRRAVFGSEQIVEDNQRKRNETKRDKGKPGRATLAS